MKNEPDRFKELVHDRYCNRRIVISLYVARYCYEYFYSIRRQLAAIDKLHARDMYFFDYGNAFLLTAKRAGMNKREIKRQEYDRVLNIRN
jgi:hypothetical protein